MHVKHPFTCALDGTVDVDFVLVQACSQHQTLYFTREIFPHRKNFLVRLVSGVCVPGVQHFAHAVDASFEVASHDELSDFVFQILDFSDAEVRCHLFELDGEKRTEVFAHGFGAYFFYEVGGMVGQVDIAFKSVLQGHTSDGDKTKGKPVQTSTIAQVRGLHTTRFVS